MALLRRKAILDGIMGRQRKWLVVGGVAWVIHWLGRIFGGGEPTARYTREVSAGERIFVVHEPLSAAAKKKAARRESKAAAKSGKAVVRGSRKAAKAR
jgi:hypothetical protein